MDIIGLQGLIGIGGISILAVVVARYSLDAVFNTMQFFMIRLHNRNQK